MELGKPFRTALKEHCERATIRFGLTLTDRYSNAFYIDFKLIHREVINLLDTIL